MHRDDLGFASRLDGLSRGLTQLGEPIDRCLNYTEPVHHTQCRFSASDQNDARPEHSRFRAQAAP